MSDNLCDRVTVIETNQKNLKDDLSEIKSLIRDSKLDAEKQNKELQDRIKAMELQWSRVRGVTGTLIFVCTFIWSAITFWYGDGGVK